MTLSRLSLLLGLVGLGAVSIGGARATARWAAETRVAETTAAADRAATRRIAEAVARARVRILLEQARLTTYDAAPVHLVLSRTDGRLRVERGAVVLRTAELVTTAPIGVDTVRSVGLTALGLATGGRLDATAGLSVADLVVLRRVVRIGTVVYVL